MELADFFIWNGYQYFAYLGKKPTMNDGKLAIILKPFSNRSLLVLNNIPFYFLTTTFPISITSSSCRIL